MSDLFDDINSLFSQAEPATVDTGALSRLLPIFHPVCPALVFLADNFGEIVDSHGVHSENSSKKSLQAMASRLVESLADRPDNTIVLPGSEESGQALIGVRIEEDGQFLGVLGMKVASRNAKIARDADWSSRVAPVARLAWKSAQTAHELKEQQTRNRQLLAERETLKRSHAELLESNLQEKENRLQEKHDHILHLESEVRKRSVDLQEALKKAEQANQTKSEFLANMSHEIRTPMTAILGFAENLLESTLSDEERDNAARTILRNGKYLIDIINDILDISKIEAGKYEIESIRCSPSQILAEVQSLMQVRADAKALSLHFENVGAIPETVRTDPTRLRQILINLIGNAIKFTESGGIRVLTRIISPASDAPTLQLDVIDTGIGMSPEQAERIFQPFAQADSSTTRKFGGTGLGLAISKRLAEMLGGGIALADTQPGCGTRFRVTITTGPLDGVAMVDRPTDVVRSEQKAENHKTKVKLNCRILLAEDGPDNQRLISFVLRKAGADVTVAENGKIAFEKVMGSIHQRRENDPPAPFDVVLMDMQMPVLDGYGATKLLREKGYDVPIIALTAHAMAGDREKCIDAGCDDYATKPIDRIRLLETIAAHLPAEKVSEEAAPTNARIAAVRS